MSKKSISWADDDEEGVEFSVPEQPVKITPVAKKGIAELLDEAGDKLSSLNIVSLDPDIVDETIEAEGAVITIESEKDMTSGKKYYSLCELDLSSLLRPIWHSREVLEAVSRAFAFEAPIENGLLPPLTFELVKPGTKLRFWREATIVPIAGGALTVKRQDYGAYGENLIHTLFMGLQANTVNSPFIAFTYGGFSATVDLQYSNAITATDSAEIREQTEIKVPLQQQYNINYIAYQATLAGFQGKVEREGEMSLLDLFQQRTEIEDKKASVNRMHPSEAWGLVELCIDVLRDLYVNHRIIHGDSHGHNWRVAKLDGTYTHKIGNTTHKFRHLVHLIDWGRGSFYDESNKTYYYYGSNYYALPAEDVKWWHDASLLMWGFITSYTVKGEPEFNFTQIFAKHILGFMADQKYSTAEISQLILKNPGSAEAIYQDLQRKFQNYSPPANLPPSRFPIRYLPAVGPFQGYGSDLRPFVQSREPVKLSDSAPCPRPPEMPTNYNDDIKSIWERSREISKAFYESREMLTLYEVPTAEQMDEARQELIRYFKFALQRPLTLNEQNERKPRKITSSEWNNINQLVGSVVVNTTNGAVRQRIEQINANAQAKGQPRPYRGNTIFPPGSEGERLYQDWYKVGLADNPPRNPRPSGPPRTGSQAGSASSPGPARGGFSQPRGASNAFSTSRRR